MKDICLKQWPAGVLKTSALRKEGNTGGEVALCVKTDGTPRIESKFNLFQQCGREPNYYYEKDGVGNGNPLCVSIVASVLCFGNEITCPQRSLLVNISSSNKLDLSRSVIGVVFRIKQHYVYFFCAVLKTKLQS